MQSGGHARVGAPQRAGLFFMQTAALHEDHFSLIKLQLLADKRPPVHAAQATVVAPTTCRAQLLRPRSSHKHLLKCFNSFLRFWPFWKLEISQTCFSLCMAELFECMISIQLTSPYIFYSFANS